MKVKANQVTVSKSTGTSAAYPRRIVAYNWSELNWLDLAADETACRTLSARKSVKYPGILSLIRGSIVICIPNMTGL